MTGADPHAMKLAVAGCARNCSEALCKDLGVVAVEGGRWEIYVGGAAGAHVLQYYREGAKWLERTYSFVPRVGIEADLDRRLHRSVARGTGARDSGQFRLSLPLDVLPRVPVPLIRPRLRRGYPASPAPGG